MKRSAKHTLVICLCASLIFTLWGCSDPSFTTIEKAVNYLASDELEGRFPGEKGNALAQEFIARSLEDFNIAPFGEDYPVPYETKYADIKSISLSVEGAELATGDDLMVYYCMPNDVTAGGVLTLYGDAPAHEQSKLMLFDSGVFIDEPMDSTVKAIIREEEEKIYPPFVVFRQGYQKIPTVYVTSELYGKLKAQAGNEAELVIKAEEEILNENNVAGIIKADSNAQSCALVISAHFDHLGVSREGTIFHGALDNASGTSAVLNIAKKLAQQLDGTKMQMDVIFALFNSEEMDLFNGGSAAFSAMLDEKYTTVYDINIDCIGEAKSEDIFIHNSSSGEYAESLASLLVSEADKNGKNASLGKSASSDHASFKNGITVSSGFGDIINTADDVIELLDFEKLEKTADIVLAAARRIAYGEKLEAVGAVPESWPQPGNAKLDEEIAPYISGKMRCQVVDFKGELLHLISQDYSMSVGDGRISPYAFLWEALLPEGGIMSLATYERAEFESQYGTKYRFNAFMPLPADGKCPYTGLTPEEHELNKIYEHYDKENIGQVAISFPADYPYFQSVVVKKYPHDTHLERVFQMAESYSEDLISYRLELESYTFMVGEDFIVCQATIGEQTFEIKLYIQSMYETGFKMPSEEQLMRQIEQTNIPQLIEGIAKSLS